MDRSRVIVTRPVETAPQPATGAPKEADEHESPGAAFMKEFYRQRAGARKLQHDGKCDLMSRPKCYETCEFASFCSEWKYTVKTLF